MSQNGFDENLLLAKEDRKYSDDLKTRFKAERQ